MPEILAKGIKVKDPKNSFNKEITHPVLYPTIVARAGIVLVNNNSIPRYNINVAAGMTTRLERRKYV